MPLHIYKLRKSLKIFLMQRWPQQLSCQLILARHSLPEQLVLDKIIKVFSGGNLGCIAREISGRIPGEIFRGTYHWRYFWKISGVYSWRKFRMYSWKILRKCILDKSPKFVPQKHLKRIPVQIIVNVFVGIPEEIAGGIFVIIPACFAQNIRKDAQKYTVRDL